MRFSLEATLQYVVGFGDMTITKYNAFAPQASSALCALGLCALLG